MSRSESVDHTRRHRIADLRAGVLVLLALAVASMAPSTARAATPSVATSNVNLRAGPATSYPVVTVVPAGAQIVTYGCISSYAWCDIGYGTARGWVSASYITATGPSGGVVVSAATAAAVGITVVGFSKAYWNSYYTAYPWYGRWTAYAPHASGGAVAGCVGAACGGARRVTGANGGTVTSAGGCGPNGCGGARRVVGPNGGTAGAAGGCARGHGCGVVRRGPNGGTTARGFHR